MVTELMFFSHFMFLYLYNVAQKKKTWKSRLKLGFHCPRHFMSPLSCWQIWKRIIFCAIMTI